MKIVFATNNEHKLEEIRQILGNEFEIVSLKEIGCNVEIPETADTLEGNALQKAQYVAEKYHTSCFADDTGLEVEALDGAPGVHSARYAEGTNHDSEANVNKLLRELGDNNNRNARFRTVIALIEMEDGKAITQFFEGTVNGSIAKERSGNNGFGYDPVFVPTGYDKSFAELGTDTKNKISHRALAVKKLVKYLRSNTTDL